MPFFSHIALTLSMSATLPRMCDSSRTFRVQEASIFFSRSSKSMIQDFAASREDGLGAEGA